MMGVMIGLGCCGATSSNLWVWFEAYGRVLVVPFLVRVSTVISPPSLEAGMKYLVQSALGSVLVLLGIRPGSWPRPARLNLDKIRMATQVGSPAMLAAGALFRDSASA